MKSSPGDLCASVTDQALEAFQLLSKVEGIIPALESAVLYRLCGEIGQKMGPEKSHDCCLSGRGDKDGTSQRHLTKREEVRWKRLTEHFTKVEDQQQGSLFGEIMKKAAGLQESINLSWCLSH